MAGGMHHALLALVLFVLGPGPDAQALAPAIVGAVEWRAARGLPPVTGSPAEDAVLVATFVRHESGASLDPAPQSHDARARQSCGPLQQQCARVAGRSPRQLVAIWLHDAARGGVAGLCGYGRAGRRIARQRLSEARAALTTALAAPDAAAAP